MKLDELNGRYQHLRNELDKAYSAPVWDSHQINLIVDAMVPVEFALASIQPTIAEDGGQHV